MGTTYNIKISDSLANQYSTILIESKIDSILEVVNTQMSTYIKNSEITKFNNSSTKFIKPSEEFRFTLEYAKRLAGLTNGMFDITINPILELWGFSKPANDWKPPTKKDIYNLLQNTGNDKWSLTNNFLYKNLTHVQIDVNAIAKGYAVDLISQFFKSLGFMNFMIEIGGEVYCSGYKQDNKKWTIGVEIPDTQIRSISKILTLVNKGIATSGDYRNFIKFEDRIYSHIINPQTGYPINHSLASATVIAPTCMEADGLATAFLVMGTEDALRLVDSLDGVECMLIERTHDGYELFMSSGFSESIL